ncbi:MAG: patatin-like phospholipase family protein [Candidatus Eiseniibacteriota bacterium]
MKKLGVALSGGGARGAAHTGVLRVLRHASIPVHCIAGTSSGAIVGAFHAAGVPPEKQLAFAQRLRWRSLRMLGIPKMGFFHTGELERFLIEVLGDIHFEDLKIPLAVVATDFRTAQPVVFREGRVAPAVAASAAIPIVFSPVRMGEHVLVDGGLSNNLPSDLARELGADVVLGVSVLSVFDENRRYDNFFDIALGTMDLMSRPSNETGARGCDLCLAPLHAPRSPGDLARAPALVAEGEAAMLRNLPRLKQLLADGAEPPAPAR